MHIRCLLAVLTIVPAIALAKDGKPGTYADASKAWERVKDTAEYQTYASEFAQFNNAFYLDEKDGCYALSRDSVNLMLVITQPDGSEYAVVEDVLSEVDNAKAHCFQKTYRGIRTKIPPFVPFVLQMSFG